MIDPINEPIIIKTSDSIIDYALSNEADNIYLEPELDNKHQQTGKWLVRYRIYGDLSQPYIIPADQAIFIIARFKKLAKIKQGKGSFKLERHHHPITCEITLLKALGKEKIIISLRTKPALAYSLSDLGMAQEHLIYLKQALMKKKGIILLTGPTASGKTSTAYSILQAINSPKINIYTIEQPLKTSISSINQVELNQKLDINELLRHILDHGADVLYLNHLPEYLDLNLLSDIAMSKLIIISLKSNNIPDVMQLTNKLLPCLNLVINQKLANTVCENCSADYKLDYYILEDLHDQFDLEDTKTLRRSSFCKGKGCHYCNYTGYGRQTGLFEFLPINQRINELNNKQIMQDIKPSMLEGAFSKALEGAIPIAEIQRLF